jgi:hypothetical protein
MCILPQRILWPSRQLDWMRRRFYLFLFAWVLGCGSGDAQPIEVVDSQLMVIDLADEKRTIPAGELYDSKTGQPAVKSVLVLDRRTKQQLFIELDQLSPQTQMDSHYILVTGD